MATLTSLRTSLIAAALVGLALMLATRRVVTEGPVEEDLTPSSAWTAPVATTPIDQDRGPVLVMVEYLIDPARADEFRAVMQETRRTRLRHGALAWELFHDVGDPSRYFEYIVDESWVEHLRRFDRFTHADEELRKRRFSFHLGPGVPVVTRCVAEQLERH